MRTNSTTSRLQPAFGAWSAPAPRKLWLEATRSGVRTLVFAVLVMTERSRTRRDLAEMTPYLLRDVGITPGQRAEETRKWFWQP